MKHSDVLVIIPCYNEQENIERVVNHQIVHIRAGGNQAVDHALNIPLL